ncbi:MAG: hypothetical protein K2M98_01970, partial [Muribaculum sp.]|nr:hypothetical protein [Muribaculum sp.]
MIELRENESRERRTNQLYAVDAAINNAIENILSIPVPADIQGLEQYILDLVVQVYAAKSDGFSNEREIRKKYFVALRERFFQAFSRLELIAPDSYVIDDYISDYENLQYEKYCDETANVNASDKFARLSYILGRSTPSTRQRLEKELEILISYFQKYEWNKIDLSIDYKNKNLRHNIKDAKQLIEYNRQFAEYKNKAHQRSVSDAEKLAELDPDNPFIDIVKNQEQTIRKLKKRKRLMILTGVLVLIFAILCLIYGKVFFWSCVIIGCLIPITYYALKYYQRNPHKIKSIIKTGKEKTDEEPCSEDIFIDLNKNNRISNALKNIWDKYKTSIPSTIFNRSPIFAADGVKDSILFVGVNPSYNESDDEVLISADDRRSLLYGSFYKRSDAPEYFRILEEFASESGLAYSQMNLLYLRENDRNIIAQLDSEFIREQLELTYDTIQCLRPRAIIFMSDWCRQLIDGPGRWVDSKKGQLDNLTLNGTKIPVFFSDDISILNNEEKNALSRRIKIRLMP